MAQPRVHRRALPSASVPLTAPDPPASSVSDACILTALHNVDESLLLQREGTDRELKDFLSFCMHVAVKYGCRKFDKFCNINKCTDDVRLFLKWFLRSPKLFVAAVRKVHRHTLFVVVRLRDQMRRRNERIRAMVDFWNAEEAKQRSDLAAAATNDVCRRRKKRAMQRISEFQVPAEIKLRVVKDLYFRDRITFLKESLAFDAKMKSLQVEYRTFIKDNLLTGGVVKAHAFATPTVEFRQLHLARQGKLSEMKCLLIQAPVFEFSPQTTSFARLVVTSRELYPNSSSASSSTNTTPSFDISREESVVTTTPSPGVSTEELSDRKSRAKAQAESLLEDETSANDITVTLQDLPANLAFGSTLRNQSAAMIPGIPVLSSSVGKEPVKSSAQPSASPSGSLSLQCRASPLREARTATMTSHPKPSLAHSSEFILSSQTFFRGSSMSSFSRLSSLRPKPESFRVTSPPPPLSSGFADIRAGSSSSKPSVLPFSETDVSSPTSSDSSLLQRRMRLKAQSPVPLVSSSNSPPSSPQLRTAQTPTLGAPSSPTRWVYSPLRNLKHDEQLWAHQRVFQPSTRERPTSSSPSLSSPVPGSPIRATTPLVGKPNVGQPFKTRSCVATVGSK